MGRLSLSERSRISPSGTSPKPSRSSSDSSRSSIYLRSAVTPSALRYEHSNVSGAPYQVRECAELSTTANSSSRASTPPFVPPHSKHVHTAVKDVQGINGRAIDDIPSVEPTGTDADGNKADNTSCGLPGTPRIPYCLPYESNGAPWYLDRSIWSYSERDVGDAARPAAWFGPVAAAVTPNHDRPLTAETRAPEFIFANQSPMSPDHIAQLPSGAPGLTWSPDILTPSFSRRQETTTPRKTHIRRVHSPDSILKCETAQATPASHPSAPATRSSLENACDGDLAYWGAIAALFLNLSTPPISEPLINDVQTSTEPAVPHSGAPLPSSQAQAVPPQRADESDALRSVSPTREPRGCYYTFYGEIFDSLSTPTTTIDSDPEWIAVTAGRRVGVFRDWGRARVHVLGVPGSKCESFVTREEAMKYYKERKSAREVEILE
ncbi:hypothetical protein ONZ51_g8554 [Trametes cubensis]|uniref:Ribonuclease H1 N-terminal domain-containing protein n=1 Tax=Trametes cubensis TaxID=1111947 RepID=A0AAD7TPZ4_9APHY|nr:hypothetical protein ONZ51_g8554 [Trametes cubensis]